MKGAAVLAMLLGLAGCAGPAPHPAQGATPPPPPVLVVENANFELVVVETVPNADDDSVSYTAVYVDGQEAGKTAPWPRSQERRLQLRLLEGNHPLRLEHWRLPPSGEWARLPDERQPRERFVRIGADRLARLTLRYDADGRPSLRLERVPAGVGAP